MILPDSGSNSILPIDYTFISGGNPQDVSGVAVYDFAIGRFELQRTSGGIFNSTDYKDPAQNRGYITIFLAPV